MGRPKKPDSLTGKERQAKYRLNHPGKCAAEQKRRRALRQYDKKCSICDEAPKTGFKKCARHLEAQQLAVAKFRWRKRVRAE
jgi:hypothetical protein